MPTGDRKDPFHVAFFKVEIEGLEAGAFRQVSGLKTETEIYEHAEGGDNEGVRKLLGTTRHSNITLTKGWVNETVLFDWRDKIASSGANKIERKSGSIIAIGDDGKTELKRWNFSKAWPVRWEMNPFDSNTSTAQCELIEIAIEKLTKG